MGSVATNMLMTSENCSYKENKAVGVVEDIKHPDNETLPSAQDEDVHWSLWQALIAPEMGCRLLEVPEVELRRLNDEEVVRLLLDSGQQKCLKF